MHFRLVGGAKMYFRLVGGTKGAFTKGLRPRVLLFSLSDQPGMPHNPSDQQVLPFSTSDRTAIPYSTSDQSEIPHSTSDYPGMPFSLSFSSPGVVFWARGFPGSRSAERKAPFP